MHATLILLLIISDTVIAPTIDLIRASVTNEEQRVFIKCHILPGSTVSEISKMLIKIPGPNVIKVSPGI